MVLLLVAGPILFVMAVWTVVSMYRIMRPEEPQSPYLDESNFEITLDPAREPVLIGARSIRDTGRRRNRVLALTAPYEYLDGHSDGIPEAWWEDVVARRN